MPQIHTISNDPVLGTVRWQADREISGAPIKLLDNFVQNNIATVLIPQLQGVRDRRSDNAAHPFSGKIEFFKKAIPQLRAAFDEIDATGLKHLITSCAGTFNPRLIKRRDPNAEVHTPSNHAFGTAIDINDEYNTQGATPPAEGLRGSVRKLVPIFEKHGFRWGGGFSTPDGMHFEVIKITDTGENKLAANALVPVIEITVTHPFMNLPVIGKIQKKLLDQGFDPLGIDNKYGPRTEHAVREFQRAKGLPATGIVDKNMAGMLELALTTQA